MDVDEEEDDTNDRSETVSRVIQVITSPRAPSWIIRESDHEIPRASTSRFVTDQNVEDDSSDSAVTSVNNLQDTVTINLAVNEIVTVDEESDAGKLKFLEVRVSKVACWIYLML